MPRDNRDWHGDRYCRLVRYEGIRREENASRCYSTAFFWLQDQV